MTDKILKALEIGLRYSEEISNALYGVSKEAFRTVEEAEEDVRKIEAAIELYKSQQAQVTIAQLEKPLIDWGIACKALNDTNKHRDEKVCSDWMWDFMKFYEAMVKFTRG